jgi:hypothetical protein
MKKVSPWMARLAVALAFVALIARDARANVFTNPPWAVDGLLMLEGKHLGRGATCQGTRFVPAPPHFELRDGLLTGTVELPVLRTEFPFNEAIPSWNGWAPPHGGWRVWMRAGNERTWTLWFEAGSWGIATDLATTRVAELPQGRYDVDSLLLTEPMDRVQVRFELMRDSAVEPSPSIRLFALSYSNTLGDRRLWQRHARFRRIDSPRLEARRTTFTLPVEFRSQVVPTTQWIGRICAPSSLAMAATAFGINLPTENFAAQVYDPVSDLFGVWHRVVQGGGQQGLRGYVTRFRSWEDVRRTIEGGAVICASIRFRHGEIANPPRIYARRGTQGHLFVIIGFGPGGTILVHDSASKDWGRTNVWTRDQLARAWFDKGGVGIVFTQPAAAANSSPRKN